MNCPKPSDERQASLRKTRSGQLSVYGLLVLALAFPANVDAQNFSDKFELKSFWSIVHQNGVVGLTSEVSHSGETALQLSSKSGGQREIRLTHQFALPRRGTLTVWFYDTSPGQPTLYSGLYAFNTTDSNQRYAVNVADWSGTHYVWNGPGVSETLTSVVRTAGWHEFKLRITPTQFDALIDGTVVGSVPGDFKFDQVILLLSGPSGNPNATFFFDDFKVR